jgi:hypothetical protein
MTPESIGGPPGTCDGSTIDPRNSKRSPNVIRVSGESSWSARLVPSDFGRDPSSVEASALHYPDIRSQETGKDRASIGCQVRLDIGSVLSSNEVLCKARSQASWVAENA